MESFKGLKKTTLKRIAQSRDLETTGTTNEIISRLITHDAPFSIDLTQSQEEIILSLISVPTNKIRDYLISKGFQYDKREDAIGERIQLLEGLLEDKLSLLSRDIVSLSQSSLASLQRQAGRADLGRADLIRNILKIGGVDKSYIEHLRDELDLIGFEIIEAPPKREPIELNDDEIPSVFEASEVRGYLEEGLESSYFPDYLLQEVIQEDLLFDRNVNVRSFSRRMVSDPLSLLWDDVREVIKDKDLETLQALAKTYGYSADLSESELEFLFQRQYLRKYAPYKIKIPEELKLILISQTGDPNFEDKLSPEAKDRLKLYSEWYPFDNSANLQHLVRGYGIELPYENAIETFKNDLLAYLDITDEQLNAGDEDLEFINDTELLYWCPTLPYGRSNMLREFRTYWETPRTIFLDNIFYHCESWEDITEIEKPSFEEMDLEELLNILPYLKDSEYQEETLGVLVDSLSKKPLMKAPDKVKKFFVNIANGVAAHYGSKDGIHWKNTRNPPNEEARDNFFSKALLEYNSLSERGRVAVAEWRLYSIRELDFVEGKIGDIINNLSNKSIPWLWLETAFYYYANITGETLSNNIPILFREG